MQALERGSGLILVETVIAVGILGIALAGAIIVMTHALKTSGETKELQTATFLAIEEVELVKNIPYPYPDDPANADAHDNIVSRSISGVVRSGFSFDLDRDVTDFFDAAGNQIRKEIAVSITLTGGTNPLVTYRTIMVRDGI